MCIDEDLLAEAVDGRDSATTSARTPAGERDERASRRRRGRRRSARTRAPAAHVERRRRGRRGAAPGSKRPAMCRRAEATAAGIVATMRSVTRACTSRGPHRARGVLARLLALARSRPPAWRCRAAPRGRASAVRRLPRARCRCCGAPRCPRCALPVPCGRRCPAAARGARPRLGPVAYAAPARDARARAEVPRRAPGGRRDGRADRRRARRAGAARAGRVLVPVPSHPRRGGRAGFDHARPLARRCVGRRTGLPRRPLPGARRARGPPGRRLARGAPRRGRLRIARPPAPRRRGWCWSTTSTRPARRSTRARARCVARGSDARRRRSPTRGR